MKSFIKASLLSLCVFCFSQSASAENSLPSGTGPLVTNWVNCMTFITVVDGFASSETICWDDQGNIWTV